MAEGMGDQKQLFDIWYFNTIGIFIVLYFKKIFKYVHIISFCTHNTPSKVIVIIANVQIPKPKFMEWLTEGHALSYVAQMNFKIRWSYVKGQTVERSPWTGRQRQKLSQVQCGWGKITISVASVKMSN